MQRGGVAVGQGNQASFNHPHFTPGLALLLAGFAFVDAVFRVRHRGGNARLMKLAVGGHNRLLVTIYLVQHLTDGGLGLPLPVEAGHAGCQQLTRLLTLRFMGAHIANARCDLVTVFPPQIQIPTGGEAEGAVGIPGACGSGCGIGYGKGSHQPLGRHALSFYVSREIDLWALVGGDALRLCFGKVNALLGDLHIRRMRQGALNQGIKLRIVIRLPPLALRPARGQRRR